MAKMNYEYKKLACRHAVVSEILEVLRSDYLALSSDSPKKEILCTLLSREEEVVPAEDIATIVEELEQERESLRIELNQYTYGKQEQSNGILNRPKAKESRQQAPQQAKRAGGRR